MSATGQQRAATRLWIERSKDLADFLSEKKTGIFKEDFARWAEDQGLSDRAAMQYWQRKIDLGELELFKNGKVLWWRWIGDKTMGLDHESPTPFTDYARRKEIEKVREQIRLAGESGH